MDPKTDCAEGQRGEHRDPHKRVGRNRPQQRRQHNGNHDQHAAHGGRARLLQMRLRPIFPDKLADLKLAQLLDDPRTNEQRDQHRGQRCESSAKGQVAEDPERVEERVELFVEQPVKQLASKAEAKRDSL